MVAQLFILKSQKKKNLKQNKVWAVHSEFLPNSAVWNWEGKPFSGESRHVIKVNINGGKLY